MKEQKENPQVFQVHCPACHLLLWIDCITQKVIKTEKGKKKTESIDELLKKEKKRKSEFDRKFEATAELEKERRETAKKKFEKALFEVDDKG
ncbi:hypothetical protein ACFLRM_00950 [Acidobacteriota bacterium]